MANVYNKLAILVGTKTGSCSGAAVGTTYASNSVQTYQIVPGTLSAYFKTVIGTSTLTFTASWQVSNDNTTFYDVKSHNNVANVAVSASSTLILNAPDAAFGWKYARVQVTTGATAAATGTGDNYDVRFSYLRR